MRNQAAFWLFMLYFVIRMINPEYRIPAVNGVADQAHEKVVSRDKAVLISFLNVFLVMLAMLKSFIYLRVVDQFSQLVQLIIRCVEDVFLFCVVFLFINLVFAILYQIVGMQIHDQHLDYPLVHNYVAFFLFTFRNSLGDTQLPKISYWSENHNHSQSGHLVMIYLIWLFWLLNQIMMLIILLNFLIANIS